MRTIVHSIIAAGLLLLSTSGASAQTVSAAGVDFLGIYGPPIYDGGGPPRRQPDVIPYTAAGREAVANYDSERDTPRVRDNCAPETMPRIVWTGNPIQIYEQDGQLVIHYERGNVVRTIAMDGSSPPEGEPNSHLGFSTGWWDGDVLTIETTHMLDGVISGGSLPMSSNARVVERYWREPGELDLQHDLDIHDSANYTEAFTMGREWIWAPDEQVREWTCADFGPNNEAPDIEEILRMLEGDE